MIVMTLNYRGLASKPKKLAICRLVSEQSVDVLFLQETMGDGVLFAGNMESLLPGWTFFFLLWMLMADRGVCLWAGEIVFFVS